MADERIRAAGIKLLIAGEFYEDEKYTGNRLTGWASGMPCSLRTDFIPDSEVKYYLCAADAVIQPYRQATQSGVTPLAYHFEKPMIVTNVGGLPALVPHGKVGLVAEPEPGALADAMLKFFSLGEGFFLPQLREEKQKYSWSRLVATIAGLECGRSDDRGSCGG